MKRNRKIFFIIGILCVQCVGCRKQSADVKKSDQAAENMTGDVKSEEETDIPEEESQKLENMDSEKPDSENQDSTEPDNGDSQEDAKDEEHIQVPTDPADFVKVQDYIPEILVDLKYYTTDNFTGQKIYEFSDAYLRYGTVEKLMKVQNVLEEQGLSLKIWDAYRPTAAQFVLWEICPDAAYVANPNRGFSSHSRGNTVDITIVEQGGNEIIMPTGFDDFSAMADRDYSDCGEEAAENAKMLEQLMIENGFEAYYGEWWHFSDVQEYPVEEVFLNSVYENE